MNPLDKFAGQAFEFAPAELFWIDLNAALAAAVGNIHNGRFPGHQAGQCSHFVGVHLGVISQAAFEGASRTVVLDTISDKVSDLSIIHGDRNFHFNASFRGQQKRLHAVRKTEFGSCFVEVIGNRFSAFHLESPLLNGLSWVERCHLTCELGGTFGQ